MRLIFLTPSLIKLVNALREKTNIKAFENLLKAFNERDFAKNLDIPIDNINNLMNMDDSLFSGIDLKGLEKNLPDIFKQIGLNPTQIDGMNEKIKNQDLAKDAIEEGIEKAEEAEAECSDKISELITIIGNLDEKPISKAILENLIAHSITKKNIEYLFQKEVLEKLVLPRDEILNTVKRFMALILGIENTSTVEERKQAEIEIKAKMIKKLFSKLSNYNLRKLIIKIFEKLSQAPVSVRTHENRNTSLYLQSMKQFYTGYILKKDDGNLRNETELKDKLKKLIQNMQNYSKKTGLGILKNKTKPLDNIRYICNNKINITKKNISDIYNKTIQAIPRKPVKKSYKNYDNFIGKLQDKFKPTEKVNLPVTDIGPVIPSPTSTVPSPTVPISTVPVLEPVKVPEPVNDTTVPVLKPVNDTTDAD
jgi:hypothetical protein